MNPTDSSIPRLIVSRCADLTVYEVLKREQRAQFGYQPLAYIRIPFAGNIEANTRLARRMCAAAITRRRIPIAPHLLFPQFIDDTDLEAAARFDHVAAEYQGGQRSTHGFVAPNCLMMDIDNDHTENPNEWVTPQGLADLLADVEFMTATSRNDGKSKHGTPARPRFHVYLLISPVTDPATYAGLKKSLADRFTFFDAGATSALVGLNGSGKTTICKLLRLFAFEGVGVVDGVGRVVAW